MPSKHGRKDPLNHPRRARILAYVEGSPGTTFRELCRATGIGASSLRHHLNVLLRAGRIVERNHGVTLRYFENHGKYDDTWREVAVLRDDHLRELHRWLCRNPEVPQKSVLAAMERRGWSRTSAQHRLKRLVEEGLVAERPRGRLKFYEVQDTVPERRHWLSAWPQPAAVPA